MRRNLARWLFGAIGAAILTLGITFAANGAFAGTGQQWCTTHPTCLNAWSGGPLVKSYDPGAPNNDFTLLDSTGACNNGITTSTCPGNGIAAGQQIVLFEYTNGGTYGNTCAGDYQNNSGDAKMGLGGPCSGSLWWGANFVQLDQPKGCNTGYLGFYNIHWKGYVFVNDGNGNQEYLNNSSGTCLSAQPPA